MFSKSNIPLTVSNEKQKQTKRSPLDSSEMVGLVCSLLICKTCTDGNIKTTNTATNTIRASQSIAHDAV